AVPRFTESHAILPVRGGAVEARAHLVERTPAEPSQRLGARLGGTHAARDERLDTGVEEARELLVGVGAGARRGADGEPEEAADAGAELQAACHDAGVTRSPSARRARR